MTTMTTIIVVVGFTLTFTAVFGVGMAITRKQAAQRKAEQERLAAEEHKRRVFQAKADDMWRLNKRLTMR
jgi:hypothetical protein